MQRNLRRIALTTRGTLFDYYRQGRQNIGKYDSFFIVGRHWNSSTPAVPARRHRPDGKNLLDGAVGGGYYLYHRGLGIAIDPGYAFLRMINQRHNISVADIDIIIVTHNHQDHLADLADVLDLSRKSPPRPNMWVTDPITGERINVDGPPIPPIPLLFAPKPVIQRVRDLVHNRSIIIRPGNNISFGMNGQNFPLLNIQFLPSIHWQTITPDSLLRSGLPTFLDYHFTSVGIRVELLANFNSDKPASNGCFNSLLITSDTMYPMFSNQDFSYDSYDTYLNSENWHVNLGSVDRHNYNFYRRRLRSFFWNFIQSYNNISADLVCLHLGGLEKQFSTVPIGAPIDFQYSGFYLGILGAIRLARRMDSRSTKLHVLTEWGEELQGERKNLTGLFSRAIACLKDNHRPLCLPSDVDLKIDLTNGLVGCSHDDKMHDYRKMGSIEKDSEYLKFESKIVSDLAAMNFEKTCNWQIY